MFSLIFEISVFLEVKKSNFLASESPKPMQVDEGPQNDEETAAVADEAKNEVKEADKVEKTEENEAETAEKQDEEEHKKRELISIVSVLDVFNNKKFGWIVLLFAICTSVENFK